MTLRAPLEHRGVQLDLDAWVCRVDGAPVHLEAKQFRLLALLLANPTRTLTHRELGKLLWRDEPSPESLWKLISTTRAKVGPIVEPVRGVGYRLAA